VADQPKEFAMTDHVYKQIKLTGSSEKSIEDAVSRAIDKASATVKNMRWFQIIDTRGHIQNNQIGHWQVTIEVGFTLEES